MRFTIAVALLFRVLLFLSGCANDAGTPLPPPLTVSTSSLPNGQVGFAYRATINATGGTAPYVWSLTSGALPAGLFLDAHTGAITGTPTTLVSGTPLNFQITDSSSPALTKSVNLTLSIVEISVSVSPKQVGLAVIQKLFVTAETNDSAGVTWSASAGSFSPGSSLPEVAVSYTAPSSPGSYTITATSVSNVTKRSSSSVYVTDLGGVYTCHNDLARDGSNA
jgi:Putative Ig domain